MALLEFLLRRPGEVLSKREILAHVWDYDFEGDVNIVEVYVRHLLRNKLDRPFGLRIAQGPQRALGQVRASLTYGSRRRSSVPYRQQEHKTLREVAHALLSPPFPRGH